MQFCFEILKLTDRKDYLDLDLVNLRQCYEYLISKVNKSLVFCV